MKKIIFGLFFVSGFCALLYQTVWLRLAYAAFGINAQVISIVVSVFMAGLVLGSWLTGRWLLNWSRSRRIESLYLYAVAEAGIGIGGLVVPKLFHFGHNLLLASGQTNSLAYLLFSAAALAAAMLPWCFFMGCTIPLMMDYVKRHLQSDRREFSFLYLANTLGAMTGVVFTAVVLVETLGFVHTLLVASVMNFLLALVAYLIGRGLNSDKIGWTRVSTAFFSFKNLSERQRFRLWLLLATGFASVGFEVVWIRLFTPILETSVYAFAFILFLYLLGTCLGSLHYRIDSRRGKVFPTGFILLILSAWSIAQIWLNDPWIRWGVIGVVLCVLPLAYILGYLTPKQVDELAGGDAGIAGGAYAVNLIGCILGPLVASYLLLPWLGSKWALMVLALPLLVLLLRPDEEATAWSFDHKPVVAIVAVFLLATGLFGTTYEEAILGPGDILKNDYNAAVVALQSDPNDPRSKNLVVNGVSMTLLSPVTKIMADLPLAMESTPPKNALVICLGMGTTFRSAASWGIQTTAVELTPAVKAVFPFFFSDANQILQNSKNQIVIDDGRRYLERTDQKYDLIVIDPPPPVEAAGSSLLYSKEFYALAKQHLTADGILAQWYPGDPSQTQEAVIRALTDEFAYVEAYRSIGQFGYHFFASNHPFTDLSSAQLAQNMPAAAQADLMEWNDYHDPNVQSLIQRILNGRIDITKLENPNPAVVVTDDQPYNEYFLLRGGVDK